MREGLILLGCIKLIFACHSFGDGISDSVKTSSPTFELRYRPPIKWTTAQSSTPTLGQSKNLNFATKAAKEAVSRSLQHALFKIELPEYPLHLNFKDLKGIEIDIFDNDMDATDGIGNVENNTVVSICKTTRNGKAEIDEVVNFDDEFYPFIFKSVKTSKLQNEKFFTNKVSSETPTISIETSSATSVTTDDTFTTIFPPKNYPAPKFKNCTIFEDYIIESSFTVVNGPILTGKQWKVFANNMQNMLSEKHYLIFEDEIIVKS